ncbi:Fic family protein [Amnibacterium sp.]|uniref:type II toxin-antitoxin system death-on-curing family toxin n=1 Tax=Amnibacterium sp. TaxID=1872496 RepID=UPI0026133BB8|nr:Fic family protein [Amnibacterium sp.]MCU1473176.1 death-on-curing protein [Amnibacterium sp.]
MPHRRRTEIAWGEVSTELPPSQVQQTEYLSIDDVVQIVEMFSEAPLREAVRDLGLLIGAVERPALKYRGMDVYTPLAMKAAAFMESLARNNSLFDGNKRLAWLATNVFLELNGATVHFSDNEIFSLLREVQQGYLATNELAHRLHTRIGPAQPR